MRCGSARIGDVNAKCRDLCYLSIPCANIEGDDYVPGDIGLGEGGDYLAFEYCLDCGQIQGDWPVYPEHRQLP